MWVLTKWKCKNTHEYVAKFDSTTLPKEHELAKYISSNASIKELLDKGTSNFDGVEWRCIYTPAKHASKYLNKKYLFTTKGINL